MRILALWVFLLVAAVVPPRANIHAQIVINEVLASNARTNVDEDGDSSDWVELLNVSARPVELGGYSLSDDSGDERKWMFPPITLPAGGCLLYTSDAADE